VSVGSVVSSNILRIIVTLLVGACIGSLCGLAVPRRTTLKLARRRVFTGATVESFLIFISVALIAFGAGHDNTDHSAFIPIGFATGSIFSPELLVITIGTAFAASTPHDVLHGVEETLGGVWVFGQLILFTMLGSKTTFEPFEKFPTVLPMMLIGFVFRGIGILVCMYVTRGSRICEPGCTDCKAANVRSVLYDAAFCFLATLPRATLQGALSGIPLRKGFFSNSGNGGQAQQLIADAGRIYIPVLAIGGSLVLDLLGPTLLRLSSSSAHRHESAAAGERERQRLGGRSGSE